MHVGRPVLRGGKWFVRVFENRSPRAALVETIPCGSYSHAIEVYHEIKTEIAAEPIVTCPLVASILHETEKAYLLSTGGMRSGWVPKSVVHDNGDGTFTMPENLAIEKGLI